MPRIFVSLEQAPSWVQELIIESALFLLNDNDADAERISDEFYKIYSPANKRYYIAKRGLAIY